MKFTAISIINDMIELYQKSRDPQTRFFDGYLKLIQTPDKKDLQRPLPFFNPMAKNHILDKLQGMKSSNFEQLFTDACAMYSDNDNSVILQTFWNLADDVAGGRTIKEEVQATSKNIRPFIKRGFCVIVFFASEEFNGELIASRVQEYTQLYKSYPL